MSDKKKTTLWERYLTKEIGIEFKACLYFFAILFFYCVFRMIRGSFEASILHMAEMILSCYAICYIQLLLFNNFDEADRFGAREYTGLAVCTCLYGLISFFGGWFERKPVVSLILGAYVIFLYFCVFLIYKTKRRIDDKVLNEELKIFQTEHKK
ncbi:MAG: DUF3021 domain-containing protein [Lachnospiraceae bacterium]|nr:DUF3021 domain-containing protein [Lachnospiraceae bacterium]